MKKLFSKKPNSNQSAASVTLKQQPIKRMVIALLVVGVALFAASGYYWYQNVFTDPSRVMSDMLDKSLQTKSVYRTVTQESEQSNVNQSIYVSFTPDVLAQSVTNLQQTTSMGETSVITETLGTKTSDYIRYKAVDVGANNPDAKKRFDPILNVWGKRDANEEKGESASFLTDGLFVAVPFGNLDNNQRHQLKEEISKVNLYNTKSSKTEFKNGRPVMTYEIELDPKALVQVLAKYSLLTGVGNPSELDPAQYDGAAKIQVKMAVDVLSRHLKSVEFVDSARTETYTGYNVVRDVKTPKDTISLDELQARISGVEAAQNTEQTSGN